MPSPYSQPPQHPFGNQHASVRGGAVSARWRWRHYASTPPHSLIGPRPHAISSTYWRAVDHERIRRIWASSNRASREWFTSIGCSGSRLHTSANDLTAISPNRVDGRSPGSPVMWRVSAGVQHTVRCGSTIRRSSAPPPDQHPGRPQPPQATPQAIIH